MRQKPRVSELQRIGKSTHSHRAIDRDAGIPKAQHFGIFFKNVEIAKACQSATVLISIKNALFSDSYAGFRGSV
jgi:hypothetical protein